MPWGVGLLSREGTRLERTETASMCERNKNPRKNGFVEKLENEGDKNFQRLEGGGVRRFWGRGYGAARREKHWLQKKKGFIMSWNPGKGKATGSNCH